MKAKLSGNAITLQNGVKFLATEGETEEDFVGRVIETIDRDYCDELIVEGGETPYTDGVPATQDEIPAETEPEPSPEPVVAPVSEEDNPYKNVGKRCSFSTQRTAETVTGRIIWVYNDKRKDLLYYRVRDAKGKIHIKRINSKTLTVYEDN